MPILAAFAVPHPPLAVAGVGRGRQLEISATLDAYAEVARRIAQLKPDACVITSPHATCYADYIHISPGAGASGDFANFGDPDDEMDVSYDEALVRAIAKACAKRGVPAGCEGQRVRSLDHGTMVPWSFVQNAGFDCPIVRVGISGLSPAEHYRFGECVREAVDELGRRAVWVASGDLSHKLLADGPYGFSPDGPVFDELVCKAFASGDFLALLTCDHGLAERAAECGLRSFQMMAGAFDRTSVSSELLSHEGPFGVGYGVAAFVPTGPDPSRNLGEQYEKLRREGLALRKQNEDPWVRVSRTSLEAWVREGRRIRIPDDLPLDLASNLPDELISTRAGAFCSIKKDGELRGCIGTTAPTQPTLAEEIASNAVSAAARDPRFSPVTPDELDDLVYSVDVLGTPEKVSGPDELDPARYGVIVQADDGRRGLLLPDLDGVDTVEEQVGIARRKGGIAPHEHVTLMRFEVVRHT